MRRLLAVIVVCLILDACSGSARTSNRPLTVPIPGTFVSPNMSTTTALPAFVTLDRVGVLKFCATVDGFCADFPALEPRDSGSSGMILRSFPAEGAAPAYNAYASSLPWGLVGTTMVFCYRVLDPPCYDQRAGDAAGDRFDGYSVSVFVDNPATTLDQADFDCQGWPNRQTSPTILDGEPALHVTCNYRTNPAGVHDLVFARHGGRLYEVSSIDRVHEPYFALKFLASFRFAASTTA